MEPLTAPRPGLPDYLAAAHSFCRGFPIKGRGHILSGPGPGFSPIFPLYRFKTPLMNPSIRWVLSFFMRSVK